VVRDRQTKRRTAKPATAEAALRGRPFDGLRVDLSGAEGRAGVGPREQVKDENMLLTGMIVLGLIAFVAMFAFVTLCDRV
jgi:hypothetical protein